MKTLKIDLEIKESDIAVVGVIATVILYVMNVIGTGVIVGGDVGHIDTEIPFYGFFAPVIFTAFAAFAGYYTKKHSMKNAFIAIYVTLLLPFASYPLAAIGLFLPFMFLCMPVGSLWYYLHDNMCDILGVTSYSETGTKVLIFTVTLLLIPIITAPLAYRFTVKKED